MRRKLHDRDWSAKFMRRHAQFEMDALSTALQDDGRMNKTVHCTFYSQSGISEVWHSNCFKQGLIFTVQFFSPKKCWCSIWRKNTNHYRVGQRTGAACMRTKQSYASLLTASTARQYTCEMYLWHSPTLGLNSLNFWKSENHGKCDSRCYDVHVG